MDRNRGLVGTLENQTERPDSTIGNRGGDWILSKKGGEKPDVGGPGFGVEAAAVPYCSQTGPTWGMNEQP